MSRKRNMGQKTKRRRVRSLLKRDGPWCFWCRCLFSEENPPTLDHVVELSEGGPNSLDNLVLACQPCNNRRSNDPKWRGVRRGR